MVTPQRTLLEIFKFLTPNCVLLPCSSVSRQWLKASNSPELWLNFVDMLTPLRTYPRPSACCAKQYYVALACPSNYSVVHCDRRLELFFAPSREILRSVFTRSKDICRDSFGVMVSTLELLLIEVNGQWSRAEKYNFGTGKRTHLAGLLLLHESPSGVLFRKRVYLFGGMQPGNAEVLDLEANQWRQLPDMLSFRKGFAACLFRQCVYLCGGNTTNCEKYSIRLNDYYPLPQVNTAQGALVFVYNHELMVVSGTMWYALRGNRLEKRKEVQEWIAESVGPVAPVVYGGKVLVFGFQWGTLYEIDVENGRVESRTRGDREGYILVFRFQQQCSITVGSSPCAKIAS